MIEKIEGRNLASFGSWLFHPCAVSFVFASGRTRRGNLQYWGPYSGHCLKGVVRIVWWPFVAILGHYKTVLLATRRRRLHIVVL
jgi:hypothetical protein